MDDSRVFTVKKDDGTERTARVRRANRRELEAADLEQSRVFNQALLAGLPPRGRLLRKLREQELWTSDDDTRIANLREQVAENDAKVLSLDEQLAQIKKIAEPSNDDVKRIVTLNEQKIEALKARQVTFRDLNQLRVEIDSMLGHTCDAKADDAHRNFLLACVAEYVKPSGEVVGRCWASVEALLAESDSGLLQRVVYEYMTFNSGMPSEWEKDQQAAAAVDQGEASGGSEASSQPSTSAVGVAGEVQVEASTDAP